VQLIVLIGKSRPEPYCVDEIQILEVLVDHLEALRRSSFHSASQYRDQLPRGDAWFDEQWLTIRSRDLLLRWRFYSALGEHMHA
jgi:hypothetical protein